MGSFHNYHLFYSITLYHILDTCSHFDLKLFIYDLFNLSVNIMVNIFIKSYFIYNLLPNYLYKKVAEVILSSTHPGPPVILMQPSKEVYTHF